MAKYDDVCKRLLDIANRHNDCLNDYDKIVTACPKRLLSRGVDLYGLYWPDMEMSKYIISKSKPTRNENANTMPIILTNKTGCVSQKDMTTIKTILTIFST